MVAQSVSIAGVRVDRMTQRDVCVRVRSFFDFARREPASRIARAWGTGGGMRHYLHITTPNPEMVVAAQTDAQFRTILNEADINTPDGTGLIWASYFLSQPRRFYEIVTTLYQLLRREKKVYAVLPQVSTGTDLLPELLRLAAEEKKSVFLLGAAPGVAECVAQKFQKKIPHLDIAGTYAGSPALRDEAEIIRRIQASGARMLFVAFGAPAQEKWIARMVPRLPRVQCAMGIGGAFDFHAGRIPRAPLGLRRHGLEWLYRLWREPRRLPRIWRATVVFATCIWHSQKNPQA